MRVYVRASVWAGSLIAAAGLVGAARAENWPQFRGPTGQGISSERELPTRWSATDGVLWKSPVPGSGWYLPSSGANGSF